MSSSSRLERTTNDKLWTRLLLSAGGVRVPATRAFLMPRHPLQRAGAALPAGERIKAAPLPRARAQVRRAVVEFLSWFEGPEVVVKPSGPRFHSGEGVGFFPRTAVDKIADHVLALSRHPLMEAEGVVLLEQRLAPPPVYLRLEDGYSGGGPFAYRNRTKLAVRSLERSEMSAAAPHEKKDFNERVYVVRGADGRPHTVPLTFFRAGTWGIPTSGQPKNPQDAAAVLSFETIRDALLRQHGALAGEAEVAAFMRERREIGRRALAALIADERTRPRAPGDPLQDQTDMIGLDVMYQLENGRLVPYVIEVNDHDAAGQHALDLFYPDRAGEHSTAWVKTWLKRAAEDAARDP